MTLIRQPTDFKTNGLFNENDLKQQTLKIFETCFTLFIFYYTSIYYKFINIKISFKNYNSFY